MKKTMDYLIRDGNKKIMWLSKKNIIAIGQMVF